MQWCEICFRKEAFVSALSCRFVSKLEDRLLKLELLYAAEVSVGIGFAA